MPALPEVGPTPRKGPDRPPQLLLSSGFDTPRAQSWFDAGLRLPRGARRRRT
jgi:hypothetical protein